LTITKQNEEILEGYNFKASHNHNVPTPIPMMPTIRTGKPTNKLELMIEQFIKEMNQLNVNLVKLENLVL
jgi:hypothetical protein